MELPTSTSKSCFFFFFFKHQPCSGSVALIAKNDPPYIYLHPNESGEGGEACVPM